MNIKLKKTLFALPFALFILFYGWNPFGKGGKSEPFFLKEKPLIVVPLNNSSGKGTVVTESGKELSPGAVTALSEKDLGVPVMAGGRILPESVVRAGNRITFSVSVPMPLYTVVHFYEQRLNRTASRGTGEKGEQYVISYEKGGYVSSGGFTYAVKNAAKGTRKRTNLVFQEGRYKTSTLIEVVHATY